MIFFLHYAIQKPSTGAELFILNRLICKKNIEIRPNRFIGKGRSLSKQEKTSKKLYLAVILSSLFIVLHAQETNIYERPENFERSHDYDALHYRLQFRFDERNKTYWGENSITLQPLKDNFNQCILDAEDFTVTAVTNSNKDLPFKQTDKKLIIYFSKKYDFKEKITFTVKYFEKNPGKGLTFGEATENNPAQINTYSWPEEAHHWFPCFDYPNDKVTNELVATVKSNYKVLSNGKLIKVTEDKKNKTKTFHWSQDIPHSTYLVMMAAGPYVVINDSLGTLPINYWVYIKDVPNAMRSFKKTPEMLDFFNKAFDFPYPWAKYDQVCIAGYGGGMENTTATTLGHDVIHDERAEQDFSSHALVAHELAHQWWGNTITERTWSNVWLSESFATYSEYLFARFDQGEEEGAVNLLKKKQRYLEEAKAEYIRPLVFNRYNDPWDIMDAHAYPKGAVILHMLRFVMGDKPFFRALKHFLNKHAFQAVDTHDLMTAIKEATGQNLDWFFEQWVFKPGHPVFEVSYDWTETTGKLVLKVNQTQDRSKNIPIYRTPVVIGIVTPGEKITKKIRLSKINDEFEFEIKQRPLMVRFDEGNYLLKELIFDKELPELIYQLKNDDVIGRSWAASELYKYKDNPAAISALIESAGGDSSWFARKSAVESLGKLKEITHIEFFKKKFSDRNSEVRAASLKVLGDYKNPGLVSFLKKQFKSDNSYLVQAEALEAIGKCGKKADIPFLKKALKIKSPRDCIKRAAQSALNELNSK